MIPYIKIPDLKLGVLTLHPFGVLVATGVLVGTALTTRRARKLGYDVQKLNSFVTWMLVAGFIGGHVLDDLFYHWDEVVKRPYSLLFLWDGLSSFGGFVGALIGIVLWKFFEVRSGLIRRRSTPQPILPFADLVLSVFPIGWIFGRSGCSVVHDHPGARAAPDALFAVTYPMHHGAPHPSEHVTKIGFIELIDGHAPRYDLGLLELMFTIVLAACFVLTWRRKLATGTYVIVSALAYAPVRFVMDFLRLPASEGGDVRYGPFTPAQWCCLALFTFGLVMLVKVRGDLKRGVDPADAVKAVPEPPSLEPEARSA